jgi:hypothetical protein
LELPEDRAFVEAPLPRFDPDRYASFREMSRLTVGQSQLHQVDLLQGGNVVLALSDAEAQVRVYDRASKRLLNKIDIDGFQRFRTGAVLSWPAPGGTTPAENTTSSNTALFVAATQFGLLLVSADTGKVLRTLATNPARNLRWSADGQLLVAVDSNLETQSSVLHIYQRDDQTLSAIGMLEFSERIDGFDLSRDNRLLALSHYPSSDLRVVDLQHGIDVFRIPGPRYAGDVALSPDGRLVAVGGDGLLLVDLLDPSRRAFHSHFYNNVSHVRFSPSGDAVVASAYDGRLRVFGVEERQVDQQRQLALVLLKELRHAGSANVYSFVFEPDGNGLVSVSGDQTIRTFRAARRSSPNDGAEPLTYRSWASAPARLQPSVPQLPLKDGHYLPASLAGPARPARIRPGRYACKISDIYKLRDCVVKKSPTGHTTLEFLPGNLLSLKGVLFDDGPVVRFEGWLTEASTIVGCDGCQRQPIHGLFRGTGGSFRGLLTFRNYHDPHRLPPAPDANAAIEEANDRFPLVLQFREAVPERKPGHDAIELVTPPKRTAPLPIH